MPSAAEVPPSAGKALGLVVALVTRCGSAWVGGASADDRHFRLWVQDWTNNWVAGRARRASGL
jgi:hypothetical protein